MWAELFLDCVRFPAIVGVDADQPCNSTHEVIISASDNDDSNSSENSDSESSSFENSDSESNDRMSQDSESEKGRRRPRDILVTQKTLKSSTIFERICQIKNNTGKWEKRWADDFCVCMFVCCDISDSLVTQTRMVSFNSRGT